MIPAPRLLWLITLLLALGLLCIPLPVLATGWWALLASSGLLLLADAWLLTRLPTPVARRRVPTSLPLGVAAKVRLRLSNPGNRSLTL
jgi:hypothetical protein